LSHGGFEVIYRVARLANAATLIAIGRVLDQVRIVKVVVVWIVLLAGVALIMAWAWAEPLLLLAIYLLRLLVRACVPYCHGGNGPLVCCRARPGSVDRDDGDQLGEGTLPILIVDLLAFADRRTAWIIAAIV